MIGRRVLVAAGVAIGVLALAGWAVSANGDSEVPWADVRRDDLVLSVAVEGDLRSRESSFLGPPQVPNMWNFKIAYLAPEGQEVEAGTPLLKFDASELERRLRERQAESDEAAKKIEQTEKNLVRERMDDELSLAEARARVRRARLQLQVPEELEKAQVLERARLDLELAEKEISHREERLELSAKAAAARLSVLRSQKERADQQVREIQQNIASMTVQAPRKGTVIYVGDWSGEKLKIGDSTWRGRMILELPDLNAMMAKGEVDEADAGKVEVGQKFRIRLDAHPDLEYAGTVRSIWQTVQQKSWRNPVKVVRLDLELDEPDPMRMRPGMRFRGKIETGRIEGALLIPATAVFPTVNGPVVYRETLLGHERIPVTLGERNERYVQVLEGLDEGDRVAERNPDPEERA